MAFASSEIIGYLNKVKPPYNISEPVQELAIKALDEIGQVNDMIVILVNERQNLVTSLLHQKEVLKILETFEGENFIFNLGHGILPETPIENLELVVRLVKNYKLS